jgi:hypothetical protein
MLAIMGPALASVLHPLFRPALALAVLEGHDSGHNFAASVTARAIPRGRPFLAKRGGPCCEGCHP